MKKNKVFVLRLSEEDRQTLERLSGMTRRSKSDVFRWALYEAELSEAKRSEPPSELVRPSVNITD